ncbi:MAG TPA: 23S rRNA (adenine(2503)-C(2))-methyltransferase RlmN [Candidatus Edwardsbacteria bacterium]|nr:23S rRNA (adenine(2503)-C(2))-methyltransferase RlmN [Candidatus Edwardsbacteria bacterium]
MRSKPSLKGRNADDLTAALRPFGKRAFHARQIMSWFYQRGVSDFQRMTDLAQPLRDELQQAFAADELDVVTSRTSSDGTRKLLFRARDGEAIESVLIPGRNQGGDEDERLTACISSQAGCTLKCGFCATGSLGFARDLTPAEIVDQLFHLQLTAEGRRITNVVFMGMGEPFLNYDHVLYAARLINSHLGFNLGARHITFSTAGIVPGILRLAREPEQFKLAISLNAPNDAIRSRIMPVNRKYPLKQLLAAADHYAAQRGKLVFFEYVLLDGVNDSLDHARQLAQLLRGFPGKINLIGYNRYSAQDAFKPTPPKKFEQFFRLLSELFPRVTVRHSKGQDIQAACGQLKAVHAVDKS